MSRNQVSEVAFNSADQATANSAVFKPVSYYGPGLHYKGGATLAGTIKLMVCNIKSDTGKPESYVQYPGLATINLTAGLEGMASLEGKTITAEFAYWEFTKTGGTGSLKATMSAQGV